MRLDWNPQALDDRDAIMDHIALDSPNAAINVDDEIERQVDTLIEHPELGRQGRVADTRELVIARTPYLAIYTFDRRDAYIEVLRVLHVAQQWPPA